MSEYFFAYGTNISQDELNKHCPGAVLIGYGMLNNYMLEFRGYTGHAIAQICKKKGEVLPVAIWELPPESRYTIENYEKFPYLYKRQKAKAVLRGQKVTGIIYINKQDLPVSEPDEKYLAVLRQAYKQADFDEYYIDSALQRIKNNEDKL